MRITNFTGILIENQVHSAVRVSMSSKSIFNNYLSAVLFAAFLVVLGPFWLYVEFDDRYPKKPVLVTKKDISDYNYQSIYNGL